MALSVLSNSTPAQEATEGDSTAPDNVCEQAEQDEFDLAAFSEWRKDVREKESFFAHHLDILDYRYLPATEQARWALKAHIGEGYLNGCPDRDFFKSRRKITAEDGTTITKPIMYRTGLTPVKTPEGHTDFHYLGYNAVDPTGKPLYQGKHCPIDGMQYVTLTTKTYAPVIVVDVDIPGVPGGLIRCLHLDVQNKLYALMDAGINPDFLGINPTSGKCQMIWCIDPIYQSSFRKKEAWFMKKYRSVCRLLSQYFDGDTHFCHRISRNPFYTGNDENAYRWYCQDRYCFGDRMPDRLMTQLSIVLCKWHYANHPELHKKSDKTKEAQEGEAEKRPPLRLSEPDDERWATASLKQLCFASDEMMELIDLAQKKSKVVRSGRSRSLYKSELAGEVQGVQLMSSGGKISRNVTAFKYAYACAAQHYREHGEIPDRQKIIKDFVYGYDTAHRRCPGKSYDLPSASGLDGVASRIEQYISSKQPHKVRLHDDRVCLSVGFTQRERRCLVLLGEKGGREAAKRWHYTPDTLRDERDKRIAKRRSSGKTKRSLEQEWDHILKYRLLARQGLSEGAATRRTTKKRLKLKVKRYARGYLRQHGVLPTYTWLGNKIGRSRSTICHYVREFRSEGTWAETADELYRMERKESLAHRQQRHTGPVMTPQDHCERNDPKTAAGAAGVVIADRVKSEETVVLTE